ncbi:MAG: SDR family oxidoreductase [bacterium]
MNAGIESKDKVALVTGGASGIGKATALRFARAGMKVVVADINDAGIQKTLDELKPAQALGVRVDVRSETDVDAMVRKVEESFGRIDILVHSAGILRAKDSGPKALADMTAQEMHDVVDINLKGTFLCNRAVVPVMMKQRSGQIVNISSTSGKIGRAFDSMYCASKFGVVGLTESLAEEVRKYNIKVFLLMPDAIATPLWDQNGPIPAPEDALDPDRVAALIEYMVGLPADTILQNVTIAPFRGGRKKRARSEN